MISLQLDLTVLVGDDAKRVVVLAPGVELVLEVVFTRRCPFLLAVRRRGGCLQAHELLVVDR